MDILKIMTGNDRFSVSNFVMPSDLQKKAKTLCWQYNQTAPDEEERYTIDLTEEEQRTVFSCLDEQCRKYLEKTCDDLLAEAGKQMEEKYS